MCFSAEASFSLGSVLAIIGSACVVKNKIPSRRLIAFIPVLFAIQQFAEGVVWLHMGENGRYQESFLGNAAVISYLAFAWIIWPLYCPAAFYWAEKVPWRRLACSLSFITGVAVAFVDTRFMMQGNFYPAVVGKSLFYPPTSILDNLFYSLSTLPPIFLSSVPQMWIFGLSISVSFLASQAIWALTFSSVWCFFAAVSSLVLLYVLGQNRQ